MHDIDRTLMEYESGTNGYEGEYEGEFDDEYEYEFEGVYEEYDEPEVFNEEEEMDLAAELLSVTDDEELNQFLGKLIKKGFSKVRKFAKSSTGRALGGLLKGVAKKALPIVGGALGTAIGGPARRPSSWICGQKSRYGAEQHAPASRRESRRGRGRKEACTRSFASCPFTSCVHGWRSRRRAYWTLDSPRFQDHLDGRMT
jgi:hypothetical protein